MGKKKSAADRFKSRLKRAEQLEKNYNNALKKRYKKDIEENIVKRIIEEFYDSYLPQLYKRKYSLRQTYKFTVIDGIYNLDISHKYMTKKHRANNEYIYKLAFVSGYHGGATSISDSKFEKWKSRGLGTENIHPDPIKKITKDEFPITGGTPYYRAPSKPGFDENGIWRPKYYKWGEEAAKSKSPMEKIVKEMNEYEKHVREIEMEIYKKEFSKWLYR